MRPRAALAAAIAGVFVFAGQLSQALLSNGRRPRRTRRGASPGAFSEGGGKRREAHVRGRRGEVALRLDEVEQPGAPGLAGVTIEMASGRSVSLDRGPGGLKSVRRDRQGKEQVWTVLGASRGEAGILGEGVRQALLRDPTYKPALSAARELL